MDHHYYYQPKPVRNYGCLNLLLDVFLTLITSGLWVFWIIIREIMHAKKS